MKFDMYMKRGFAIITTPDEENRVWIHRPINNTITVCCSFSLEGRMEFIDAINNSECMVEVQEVHTFDEDYSSFIMQCKDNPEKCAERLLEAIPELMDKHVKL